MTTSIRFFFAFVLILGGCARHASGPETSGQSSPSSNGPSLEERQAVAEMVMTRENDLSENWLRITPAAEATGTAAFTAHGLSVSPLEYEIGYRQFLDGREPTAETQAAYNQMLERQLLILRWIERNDLFLEEEFAAEARHLIRNEVTRLYLDRVLDKVTVTDAELRREYERRIDDYTEPEMVQVQIILTSSVEDAAEVIKKLENGENFAEIATANSRHASKDNGGVLEPFAQGTYRQEFEDKAFALQPGEIGTITGPNGTFVMKKIANIPATTQPFEAVAEPLRLELLQKKQADRRQQLLDRIRREVESTPDSDRR